MTFLYHAAPIDRFDALAWTSDPIYFIQNQLNLKKYSYFKNKIVN